MRRALILFAAVAVLAGCKWSSTTGSGQDTWFESVSVFDANGANTALALNGPTLFALNNHYGLLACDVTYPDYPSLLGYAAVDGSGVAVNSDIACVAAGNLYLWDVSDPWSIDPAGEVLMPEARDVALAGSHAYVIDGNNGLLIYDVSDPWYPFEQGNCYPMLEAESITLNYPWAYVLHPWGLWIVDVSDATDPVIVGAATLTNPTDAAVYGQYLYVTHEAGLTVYDISDKSHPNSVGSYASYGSFQSIAITGGYAVVCAGSAGVYLFDLSTSPDMQTSYLTAGDALSVAAYGGYIYVGCQNAIEILRLTEW